MEDITELKKIIKGYRKEKLLQMCEGYDVSITEDLKNKTCRELQLVIIAAATKLNEEELNNTAADKMPADVEEIKKESKELFTSEFGEEVKELTIKDVLGKKFIRLDDKSDYPSYFECVDVKDNEALFKYDGGQITIMLEEVPKYLTPAPIKKDPAIVIDLPTSTLVLDDTKKKGKSKETKSTESKETKNSKSGKGRLMARIQCFDSPERKKPIHEFSSFVDAKKFLGVKNVGTSLERASETGKPSRGYWWRVDNIGYENKGTPNNEEIKKDKVVGLNEEILISPPENQKENKNNEDDNNEDTIDIFEDILNN